jgi:S-adenosylmethionine decarboxylase
VKFSFIVAARLSNASEKLPATPLGGLSEAARGALDGLREARERLASTPTTVQNHIFFLQWKKNGPTVQKNPASRKKSAGAYGRRERVQALGRHLLLELFDCDAEAINSLDTVKASMVEAAKRAQATIVDVVFHEFNPFGISGVVVIAESHLAIHTWPEYRYAAVDVFSCGDVLQPQVAADYLVEQLGAARASVVELQRGIFVNHPRPLLHKPAGAPVATTPS